MLHGVGGEHTSSPLDCSSNPPNPQASRELWGSSTLGLAVFWTPTGSKPYYSKCVPCTTQHRASPGTLLGMCSLGPPLDPYWNRFPGDMYAWQNGRSSALRSCVPSLRLLQISHFMSLTVFFLSLCELNTDLSSNKF